MPRVGKPIFVNPWTVWLLLLGAILLAAITYKFTGGWDTPQESPYSERRSRQNFLN
jgi:hypothetical protein